MVSPVHDDDTDYSDLDEEAPPAAPSSSQPPSRPKNRERLSERAPLLNTSPPPPAYADVTRLYGAPPYVARNEIDTAQPNQHPQHNPNEASHTPVGQAQSIRDLGQDPGDQKKVTRERNVLSNRKMLLCLVAVIITLIGITSIMTVKHDKSDDQPSNGGDHSPLPADGFPHQSKCAYESISDRQTFTFASPRVFSFVEVTEGAGMPTSDISGQVRLMLGPEDQEDPISTEMRVAKSSGAQDLHFNIHYTAETLRVNTPASTSPTRKACIEIDMSIWIRPGAQFEHLEIATEHLDIKIEPGMFPLPEDSLASGKDNARYISNQTDFIAMSGDLSAAYWESGRETRIDVVSGDISGRFALRDLLSVKTKSGSINVDIEPKPESQTDPRPANFIAESVSGSIKAFFPTSNATGDIPPRDFHTKVESKSGSVHGDYIHGLNTDIVTASGSIDVNVLPYISKSTGSWLRTETQMGGICVNVMPPYEDAKGTIGHLRSVHKAKSGSLDINYPQQWEGKIEAETMSGTVRLHGKDVKILKTWNGPVGEHVMAQKGQASSAMDLGTVSGSVDATIGDL
ncbi:hypothetical protein AUEXF2481DRAFT_658783 [Aureobasidium subglaciale EXF-2481]|uniref:Adhesin domain-containing protein n=1 Tax=Aureobasidium subglaciale (strain EXF-2481) TaxID=1043005 RepID=A0A074YE73_AURSE|nr:uncharacterized protein AUEXF2481DRAFT_658783 [Aureobasidium subglaciale EXF-2481]KEQ96050.1 hypothetical protein AUEXF2481DRAFT_658783 [Aureobasidium subglaciale EXF-2481]